MTSIHYQAVRSLVTMQQVLDLLHFAPAEVRGDQVRGRCPIHAASSPSSRSFSAHLIKGAFRCFKCAAKGNHLDLWAAATDQSLYQATTDLCNRLCITVPTRPAEGA
ncbi:MAG: CHC2 zinc finger domain-containing protein [Pirellulales bacterium]